MISSIFTLLLLGATATFANSCMQEPMHDNGRDKELRSDTWAWESNKDQPAWRKRDSENAVPLLPEARTGLVDILVEESLIHLLGPRFANVFIKEAADAANSSGRYQASDLYCLKNCASTLARLAPCITQAVAAKNPKYLLNCAVGQGQICSCMKCFPDIVFGLVSELCDSESIPRDAVNKDKVLSYVDHLEYAKNSIEVQGLRGDLKKSTAEAAHAATLFGGSCCGDGKTCYGLCITTCAGICA